MALFFGGGGTLETHCPFSVGALQPLSGKTRGAGVLSERFRPTGADIPMHHIQCH